MWYNHVYMNTRMKKLEEVLRRHGSLLVAFSGGVDSTFLLAVARRVLGKKNVLAVTAVSETYPIAERVRARRLARELDVTARIIRTAELKNPAFRRNPSDRCFHCKNELFAKLAVIARAKGMVVCDGTNVSDAADHRPGRGAAARWNVVSPLAEAGLAKDDIRRFSRRLHLPTWNLPAQACLASRFPYGSPITLPELSKVEKTEELLKGLGFAIVRVRNHGDLARIEVAPQKVCSLMKTLADAKLRARIARFGWRFITVDAAGYTMGCFN